MTHGVVEFSVSLGVPIPAILGTTMDMGENKAMSERSFVTKESMKTIWPFSFVAIFFFLLSTIVFLTTLKVGPTLIGIGLGIFILFGFVVWPYYTMLVSIGITSTGVSLRTRSGRETFEPWDNIIGFVMDKRTYSSLGLIYVADKPHPYSLPRDVAQDVWNAFKKETGRDPPIWAGAIRRNRSY